MSYEMRTAQSPYGQSSWELAGFWKAVFAALKRGDAGIEVQGYKLGLNDWVPLTEAFPNLSRAHPDTQSWCPECQDWVDTTTRVQPQKWGETTWVECPQGHTVAHGSEFSPAVQRWLDRHQHHITSETEYPAW